MEQSIQNSNLKSAQTLFAQSKLRRLRALYLRLALCLVGSGVLISLHYSNFENIQVAAVFSIFEIPLLWLFCVLVQFALFYADKIPFLKSWQQHLLRKTIEREQKSFENQFFKPRTAVKVE
ncbi:hypothetical protein [Flavobacterium sp. NKUCC04_CG]|uniref:hypothetical protein n=1 Tax=Flavobacterium sp. NKUCC04_CG TaxID=2842121 RepID=UPI001C5AC1EF|nr:hypothetical protein [Flavobacterium sp. NKUCC04_CG]MBW3520335.1 hypothetical protein [Flavobacterium sp. NKUCC04_CG]